LRGKELLKDTALRHTKDNCPMKREKVAEEKRETGCHPNRQRKRLVEVVCSRKCLPTRKKNQLKRNEPTFSNREGKS